MARKYVIVGTGDDVTTCDCCGRKNLKTTVALDQLDEEGGMSGNIVHFGKTCASMALGWGDSKASGERAYAKAEHEARVLKGTAIGQAILAEWADKLPKAEELHRDHSLEADSGCLVFVRKDVPADPFAVFVAKSDFCEGIHRATGESVRAFAARRWIRAVARLHIEALHAKAPHNHDRSFSENAIFLALTGAT